MTTPIFSAGTRFVLAVLLIGSGMAFSNARPLNDMFTNRTVIVATDNVGGAFTNLIVYGSNVDASKEAGEPAHASVTGGASVWWSWRAPRDGAVTISTRGSTSSSGMLDTVLAVYTGTNLWTVVEQGSNDDEDFSGGIYTSKVSFNANSNVTYQIAVDGWYKQSGIIRVSLQLGPKELAPPWAFPNPHGGIIDSTNYAGKVVLLNFWASWCTPCKAQIPELVALQENYRDAGLSIIGANVSWSDDTVSDVLSFLGSFTPSLNYETAMSNPATERAYGGVDAIPVTFVIDRQCVIRRKFVGTQAEATLEEAIVPLLGTRLSWQRNGTQMTFRWPSNGIAFKLQIATNPGSPSWGTWVVTPTVVNGTNTLVVPVVRSPQFFRLRSTN